MVGAVEIGRHLLQRLASAFSPEELASWASNEITLAGTEGPAIFDTGEAMRLDVLKRCAIGAHPGFELADDEVRVLLRRIAFSEEARDHREPSPAGPLLAAFPSRWAPAALFPIHGTCARCGTPVRISQGMLPAARRARAVLACAWCARRWPGAIVSCL